MKLTKMIKPFVPVKWRRRLREKIAKSQVRHLFGPRSIAIAENEAVVACMVKNGDFYIQDFIHHYSQLGVRHIILLDNGSTDRTTAIARRYAHVSIWQSDLSVGDHQGLLQRVLIHQAVPSGWCIQADIDELFDFPHSDCISLRQFLSYLNANSYSAALTQMLDMFADEPLTYLSKRRRESIVEAYRYYDTANIEAIPYHEAELTHRNGSHNKTAYPNAALYYGGIRKPLYGTEWRVNCLLTKHSLFRVDRELDLFPHVHFVDGAALADVSCVMRHYKLASNALETVQQNVLGQYTISKGYNAFLSFVTQHPELRLTQPSSQTWDKASVLIDGGFLFASERFKAYVAGCSDAMRAAPCEAAMRV